MQEGLYNVKTLDALYTELKITEDNAPEPVETKSGCVFLMINDNYYFVADKDKQAVMNGTVDFDNLYTAMSDYEEDGEIKTANVIYTGPKRGKKLFKKAS